MKTNQLLIFVIISFVLIVLSFFLGYNDGLRDQQVFNTAIPKQECISKCMGCLDNPPVFK